jgi:hypothetical protein
MSNRNVSWTLLAGWLAAPTLVMFLCAGLARAQGNSANYTLVVASGFLCDPGESGSCSAVAKSPNGDGYKLSGAGTFNTQTKSVTAAGTFAHEASNGTVLEWGVWIVSQLVSFDSYGIAPDALRQQRVAPGPQQFAPKRLPMSSGPMPTGGLAVFRIRLLPISGASKTALLQANCALGDVPRERSVEGIRLIFEKGGNEFSEEVGGRVLFLSMQLELSPTVKSSQQEAARGLAEPTHN